jgi:hypothetical protein
VLHYNMDTADEKDNSINRDDSSSISEEKTNEEDAASVLEDKPAIYGNGINGNDWLKDYNKDYPLSITDLYFPTLEHYIQYRRYCYTQGLEHSIEFYKKITSEDFNSYYELINFVNGYIPYYKGSIKSLEGIYALLYQDIIFARTIKALTYKKLQQQLHKLTNEKIIPKQVVNCEISSLSEEEIEFLKITLMHIECTSSKTIRGEKSDPWLYIAKLLA